MPRSLCFLTRGRFLRSIAMQRLQVFSLASRLDKLSGGELSWGSAVDRELEEALRQISWRMGSAEELMLYIIEF
jgi:hypothetical protein